MHQPVSDKHWIEILENDNIYLRRRLSEAKKLLTGAAILLICDSVLLFYYGLKGLGYFQ